MHDINAANEAYLDEPIADEAWLQENNETMRNLELPFNGNIPLTSW